MRYIIKGLEVIYRKCNLIYKLLDGDLNYNPICKCGATQTYSSLENILKHTNEISEDFTCKTCKLNRKVTACNKEYSSIKDAALDTYKNKFCIICNHEFTYDQWYQKIQHGEDLINPKCHSCSSSDNRTKLNIRYHNELSEAIRLRNLINWKDPIYRSKKSKQVSEQNHKRMAEERCWKLDDIYYKNPKLYFEFYRICNQEKPTIVYLGTLFKGNNSIHSYRKLDGDKYFKIGITSLTLDGRKYFTGTPDVSDYTELRKFPNRRQAALCEYLACEKFASIGEASLIENLSDYIKFVNEFNYTDHLYLIKEYLEKYHPEDLKLS